MSPSFTMTFASNAVVATETTATTATATDTARAARCSTSVNGSDGLGGCSGGGSGGLANGRPLKKLTSCSYEGEGDCLLSGKMQNRQV